MEVVDLIYEAAFVPHLWPDVLQQLANLSDSVGSTVFLFEEAMPTRGVTLGNLDDLLGEFLATDSLRFSTSVMRMYGLKPHSFVEVDAYLSAEEIENDPIRIKLRDLGIGNHICTAIPMPSGELVMYVLQRSLANGGYRDGSVQKLNALRPHLARAGLIATKVGFERARSTVAAMQAMNLPAAVCSDGKVIATNPLFQTIPSTICIGSGDRLSSINPTTDVLLQNALMTGRTRDASDVLSIPISSSERRERSVMHVLPLKRSARDLFSGGDVLVVLTTVKATAIVPSPDMLSGLFDLTPAEAALAISLVSGKTLKEAALESEIKDSTARSYLENIFRKTATNQQSQLVALLKSASIIR
jgi:DNA-binding CsgD family transcriptional regulator